MPEAPADEVVVVIGEDPERPDPLTHAGSVTVVETADAGPGADVGSLLESVAGSTVAQLGGLGDLSMVSLRASSYRQVVVCLDGVPLNPDGADAVDLSELPLDAFARVVVWRSAPPPELGVSSIGGVIDLVTGAPDVPVDLALAWGSWRTARARAFTAVPVGDAELFAYAEAFGTRGDFVAWSDNQTPYAWNDDTLGPRTHNDKRQGAAHVRIRGEGRVAWSVADALVIRDEALPGPVAAPFLEARLAGWRNLVTAQVDDTVGPWAWRARSWASHRDERVEDPADELGLVGGAQHDTSDTIGVLGHGRRALGTVGRVGATATARRESWNDVDLQTVHTRWAGAATADATARPLERLELGAVGQVLLFDDRALGGSHDTLIALSPTGSVLVRPTRGVAIKATAGRYLRPPDLAELFGGSGAAIGNPDLLPERGTNVDLGVVGRWDGRVSGSGELTGVANRATDRIVWVQNAQRVSVPVNFGDSRLLGLESALGLAAGPWSIDTTVTASASTNLTDRPELFGNPLPRVPALEATAATTWAPGVLRFGHQVSFVTGSWWDATGFYRAAPRTLHGVSAEVALPTGLRVGLEALNLFDRIAEVVPRDPFDPDGARAVSAITDYAGYPLAGRTILVEVGWRPPLAADDDDG